MLPPRPRAAPPRAKTMFHGNVSRINFSYAFYFTTRSRSEEDLDSHVSDTSGTYYLGGRVYTKEQIDAGEYGSSILRSNMEINNWDKVICTVSGMTVPFEENDVVLEKI